MGRAKTDKTKAWIQEFEALCLMKNLKIKRFAKEFDPQKHYLTIDYNFFLPESELLTQKGSVKKMRFDRCNITKIPTDIISKFLGIDDAIFLDGHVSKLISPDKHWIVVDIKKGNLDEWRIVSNQIYDVIRPGG
jgi:hypothetical protein